MNYHGLSFNRDRLEGLTDFTEARVTAGHELFHLMQYLYDPRNRVSQATTSGPWLWMGDATSTWLENRIDTRASYIPGTTNDNADFIRNGLETNTQEQGYGAAMFIRFLVQQAQRDTLVGDIIQRGATPGLVPTDALKLVTASPLESYWPVFAERYMAGDLYGVPFPTPSQIIGLSAAKKYRFDDDQKQGTTWNWAAKDLSAELFKIDFPFRFSSAAPIELSIEDPTGFSSGVVFRAKTGVWQRMGAITTTPLMTDAKTLADAEESLILLVAYSRAESPYRVTSEVKVRVRRVTAPITGTISIAPPSGFTGTVTSYEGGGVFRATLEITGSTDRKVDWSRRYLSMYTPTSGEYSPTQLEHVSDDFQVLWDQDPSGSVLQWGPPRCGAGCRAHLEITAESHAQATITSKVDVVIQF